MALASTYESGSPTDATKIAEVTLQTLRDRVTSFNGNGPAGLIDGKAPGANPILNDELNESRFARRKSTLNSGPRSAGKKARRTSTVRRARNVPPNAGRRFTKSYEPDGSYDSSALSSMTPGQLR